MDNKKKKRKGFTLIELIAVIAILAILGAIIVPKVTSYSTSAKQSRAIADAKVIVSAVAAYNADNDTAIADTAKISDFKATLTTISVWPSEFQDTLTVTQLTKLSSMNKTDITFISGGYVDATCIK